MSGEEQIVAEQVVQMGPTGPLTVRISQHTVEEFWRVDVSREPAGHTTTTVGAGDSFLGALVCGIASGAALESCFRQAVAAGAAALLNLGTELCLPSDVKRLAERVVLTAA